jgi:hypothetical protein
MFFSCWYKDRTVEFHLEVVVGNVHHRTGSGPEVGLSSGPSGMESIDGKVMTSSGESSRIPMFVFSELCT